MSVPSSYSALLRAAEAAADAGDFARAGDALREALALQTAALGGSHPDLASTYNNLAVVCERTGLVDEAERMYRRAFAIASAAGPAHEALRAEALENLRDFCRAFGRPLGDGAADDGDPLAAFAETPAPAPPTVPAPPAGAVTPAATARPAAPRSPVPRLFAVTLVVLALAGTAAMAWVWLGVSRPSQATGDAPAPAAQAVHTNPPASPVDAPAPPPATGVPAAMPPASRAPAAMPPGVKASGADGVAVRTAALCASLDTETWRCDGVSTTLQPGRVTYFTRVASPSATTLRHRWSQDGRVRRTVSLSIGASPSAGYRTFSRQTVTPGRWTVTLLDEAGGVLHEATVDVR